MSFVASRIDEIPRPAWIALIILGFWFWWPVGLGLLAYRAFNRDRGSSGKWQFPRGARSCGAARHSFSYAPPSGNRAFDDYRAETLRRLEEEQKEFVEYLERLRQARDKAEFDQFMADRRRPARTDDTQQA